MNGAVISSEVGSRPELQARYWWTHVAAALLIVVELCWVVPWYRTLLQISYVAPVGRTVVVLGGVMVAAYVVAELLEYLRLLKSLQWVLLAALLFFSLLVGGYLLLGYGIGQVLLGLLNLDPGAGLLVFAVSWLWGRGISLARQPIRPHIAWRRLQLALILFMAHILVLDRLGEQGPGLAWFVVFLFVGFLAVVAARVAFIGSTKGLAKNPFDRRWLLSTMAVLAATITVTAVLASLLTGQYSLLLDLLAQAIKLLLAVSLFLIGLPALILSYILGPIIMPALQRAAATATPDPDALNNYPMPNLIPQAIPETQPLSPVLQSLIFWAVIITLVVVLLIRLQRSRAGRRPLSDEPESLLEGGEVGRLLRKAVQDLTDGLSARMRTRQRMLAAERIRRIYTHLLDLCAEFEHPRPTAKTPLEFLPVMQELFIDKDSDLVLITEAYLRVRYGELPETKGEVNRIEEAWGRIREQAQTMKKRKAG